MLSCLLPDLQEACQRLGFDKPTEIQSLAIPPLIEGRDVVALAQTGSGKTAAFVLPILHLLWADPQPFYACVLVPTRELAFQIASLFDAIGRPIGARCAVIVGGVDASAQAMQLGKKPHVVVATPGRLADHLVETKGFSLKRTRFLVLDEADRLLDDEFIRVLEKIVNQMPKDRTTALFSATMTDKVAKIERVCLSKDVVRVACAEKYSTVDTLCQYYMFFPLREKNAHLAWLLYQHTDHSTIIFSTTIVAVTKLAQMLSNLGFSAIPLHGQMPQAARLAALAKFRAGTRSVLVASDLVSRGLDIPLVDLVVNYDLPTSPKTYIHRVGRTARAGKSGKAISFVTQYDVEIYQKIEFAMKRKLDQYAVPKDEVMILADRVAEAETIAAAQCRDTQKQTKKDKKTKGKSKIAKRKE